MRLAELVATSRAVGESSGRLQKIGHLAGLLRNIPPTELETAIAFLSGSARQGRIGIGSAAINDARTAAASETATLELCDVDAAFERIATHAGAGATAAIAGILRDLLRRATLDEQDFLVWLLFGELRQGALEAVLLEAVARAWNIAPARLRRAAMFAGALAPVAAAAMTGGDSALDAFIVRPFQPVRPMLAESADDVDQALRELGEASLEYKLDGARIQVHKAGDDVRVYSRSLRDVTGAVPEVVEAASLIPAREIILDGEAIALRADGTPHPFQTTMRRFGRRLDVDRLQKTLPISPVFFDCLYLDGDSLIDEPLSRRAGMLAGMMASGLIVPRLVTASTEQAAIFAERAGATGHEGVMAKAVDGLYAAGHRGQAWLKVKRARTLDLVVLAVEWGSGRRGGTLSNLHLGARDTERGGFIMLGKTFKGLSDAMLAWQTERLLALETGRDLHTVYVRPDLVVEIAFNDIQESPRYPGRLALRFARVKRYRTDKTPAEADTFDTIRAIFRQTTGLDPPAR
jgi:DNA ligase 1